MHGRIILGAALAALLAAGPTGCATMRATGDAIDSIVTGDEAPSVRAKRALVVAYDAHAAATRTVRQLLASGDIDRDSALNAYNGLVDAKTVLDQARFLLALGDATEGMDELRRAQAIIGTVIATLPKGGD